MSLDAKALAGVARSLAIYYGRPWRAAALRRHYAAFVGPGDLAFDIGAHVGNRTRALHALGAHVVAVEPQPLLGRFLAATLPHERIVLVREALGAAPGHATLNVSRRHPTVSSLSPVWMRQVAGREGFNGVDWDVQEDVRVTTLDRLIARHGAPRFCKIDAEGLEADILRGLSQALPAIAIEYVPAALDIARSCIDRLGELGPYRFNATLGERPRFAWGEWLSRSDSQSALGRLAANGRSGDLYALLEGDCPGVRPQAPLC